MATSSVCWAGLWQRRRGAAPTGAAARRKLTGACAHGRRMFGDIRGLFTMLDNDGPIARTMAAPYPIIDCEKMSAAGLTCNSVRELCALQRMRPRARAPARPRARRPWLQGRGQALAQPRSPLVCSCHGGLWSQRPAVRGGRTAHKLCGVSPCHGGTPLCGCACAGRLALSCLRRASSQGAQRRCRRCSCPRHACLWLKGGASCVTAGDQQQHGAPRQQRLRGFPHCPLRGKSMHTSEPLRPARVVPC